MTIWQGDPLGTMKDVGEGRDSPDSEEDRGRAMIPRIASNRGRNCGRDHRLGSRTSERRAMHDADSESSEDEEDEEDEPNEGDASRGWRRKASDGPRPRSEFKLMDKGIDRKNKQFVRKYKAKNELENVGMGIHVGFRPHYKENSEITEERRERCRSLNSKRH